MGKPKHCIGRKKKQYDHRVNFKSKKPNPSQKTNDLQTNIDAVNSFYKSTNSSDSELRELKPAAVENLEDMECSGNGTKYMCDSIVEVISEGETINEGFELDESNMEEGVDIGRLVSDCIADGNTHPGKDSQNEVNVINSGIVHVTTSREEVEQSNFLSDYLLTNDMSHESAEIKQHCEGKIFTFVLENGVLESGSNSESPSILNTKSKKLNIGDVIDLKANYAENDAETDGVFYCESESESSDDSDIDFSIEYEYDWDDFPFDNDDVIENWAEDNPKNCYSDSKPHQPQGNRIVDFTFLVSQIKEMNSHSGSCNFNDMNLIAEHEEWKRGFNSTFKFICSKCSYIYSLKTSPETEFMDTNYAAVVAAFAIGIGQSQLEEFTGTVSKLSEKVTVNLIRLCLKAILGIPSMAHTTFESYQKKFLLDINGATRQSMDIAAEEEIKLAVKKGNIDSKGRPITKTYIDGAWNKRSYRTNYSASSGTATLIGFNTKKVIWNDVANKYCVICARISSQNLEPYEHICNINYNGSSTGMEAKLIVKGFKECEERYNLRIDEVIADGDSSVISELNKAHIYKYPILAIGKIDCTNHIIRNCRGALRKLAAKTKFSPYLTIPKIEEIIKGIRSARMHWIKADIPKSAQIEGLRQDILNAPLHVLGSHEKCADYFCVKKNKNEPNLAKILIAANSFNSVQNALSRARLNARSILIYENTNIVEHFNSFIVKHSGNKRINFSKSGSWKGRVQFGVLDHNTKRAYSTICEFINKKPQPLMEKLEFRRMKKNLLERVKERKFVKKIVNSGPDVSYGTETCERPDLDTIEFELEKKNVFGFHRTELLEWRLFKRNRQRKRHRIGQHSTYALYGGEFRISLHGEIASKLSFGSQ